MSFLRKSKEKSHLPNHEKIWEYRINTFAVAISSLSFPFLVLISLVAIASLVAYFMRFWSFNGLSKSAADWELFANFIGFTSQAIIGVASLAAAMMLSLVFARRLEEQKQAEAKSRELIRLSEKMVDTEFYLKVMYPAWEVALKWMEVDCPAHYRAQVVGAEVRLPKNYRARDKDDDLAETSPRRHPHYKPYSVGVGESPGPAITELSESLAFATWIRFWRHVKYLMDRDLVDKADARHLFREWYMWWAPFMTEYLWVCVAVMKKLGVVYGYEPNHEGWENGSIVQILDLHTKFGIEPYCGHANGIEFGKRIISLRDEIMNDFLDHIRADPNPHIDGFADLQKFPACPISAEGQGFNRG